MHNFVFSAVFLSEGYYLCDDISMLDLLQNSLEANFVPFFFCLKLPDFLVSTYHSGFG